MVLILFLAFITIAAAIAQLLSFRRMHAYVDRELQNTSAKYLPRVSVILPCKGLDAGFKENIAKLIDQDYDDFEIIFTLASQDDPAYAALQEAIQENKKVPVKFVIAGVNPKRGQKINNQLAALAEIAADTEALVFVDSDVIARRDFLRHLVSRLADENVGATTGYRFYIPFKGDWPSLIRSLWNRMSAWELANPKSAFAWGGAMAIKRSTFERARVASHWDAACDDDLSLTTAVKDLGLTVKFIPQCLVASNGDASLREIVEWMNRQLILTKVYYPQLWHRAIRRAALLTFWLLAVVGALASGLAGQNRELIIAAAVGLTLLPVELLFLFKAQGLWQRVLSCDRHSNSLESAYDQSLWRFSAVLPLAHLVLPWMTLYSLVTNRIRWRGVTYELRSPTETIVV